MLSHCLKTNFYNSLTVGLNPKPLVISTVFSFTTPVNAVASSLSIFVFVFEEMDRRKIRIFTL